MIGLHLIVTLQFRQTSPPHLLFPSGRLADGALASPGTVKWLLRHRCNVLGVCVCNRKRERMMKCVVFGWDGVYGV